MSIIYSTKNREILLISQILKCGIGYGIELFSMLYIHELENGSFAVGYESSDERWEKIFKEPKKAAQFFVNQRNILELGFDFEQNNT